MKHSVFAFSCMALVIVAAVDCGGFDNCPGQVECPNGCCPQGYTCGANNTCIAPTPPVVSNAEAACQYCISIGQECCLNYDATVDCTGVDRTCCGNHTSCPANTQCLSNGQCS